MLRNLFALVGLVAVIAITVVAVDARDGGWGGGWDERQAADSGWHGNGVERVRVSFADLDLATRRGQRRLDRRILAAVNRICGETQETGLSEEVTQERCRSDARSSVARQVALALDRARQSAVADDHMRAPYPAVADGPVTPWGTAVR